MYNEQIKQRYLEEYLNKTTSKSALSDMEVFQKRFDRMAHDIEIPLDKDLCQLTKDDILKHFGKMLPPKRSTAVGLLSFARTYTQWCYDNHMLGCTSNQFIDVKITDFDEWQPGSDLIKDEEMLTKILDDILAPLNEDSVDNLYRPVYYLIFYGFTVNEIVSLKLDDLNEQEQSVRHPAKNTWVKIPQFVVDQLKYIQHMNSGTTKIRNGFFRTRDFYGDEFLIKRCSPDRDSYVKFIFDKSSRFDKLVKEQGYSVRFTVFSIMQSGIFCRIYQQEKQTGKVDMSEFVNFRLREGTISESALQTAYQVGHDEYTGWKRYYRL